MYPLKLEIKQIQHNISAESNFVTLSTSEGRKIFEIDDYDNYVNVELLKTIINQINRQSEW